ncbi:MAG: asparagine--tRNA ligase [Planctomycetes bacterium]|nr:asparagine--tRNA ligase [Planctomycetota bacterium]
MQQSITNLKDFISQRIKLSGWLYSKREKGKLIFLQFRDGTGIIQVVVFKDNVTQEIFDRCKKITRESSCVIEGKVREEKRAPEGVEIDLDSIEILHLNSEDFPIQIQDVVPEVNFLMEQRHLWLRSRKQVALLRVRSQLIYAIRTFFQKRNFVCVDSPILTPAACEGTTTLFKVDYFDDEAFLSQSGQLYIEAACMALGKVYCFGPTFRAEKSKTRKHLTEFWMIEPEISFITFDKLLDFIQDYIEEIVQTTYSNCVPELKILERDLSKLDQIKRPFPIISYKEAVEIIKKNGEQIQYGEDFGAPQEEALVKEFNKPVFVTRYPSNIKAFYMKPDPADNNLALCVDVIAPEGFGELIGGSQRIDDYDLLKQRILDHKLPLDSFKWYLDLRKYGSASHGGFGMGLERTLSWISGIKHVRECIPFPRLLYRIYP